MGAASFSTEPPSCRSEKSCLEARGPASPKLASPEQLHKAADMQLCGIWAVWMKLLMVESTQVWKFYRFHFQVSRMEHPECCWSVLGVW